ncbi:MAG: thioredoxin fold domain-containing protein [Alcanivorax sediminis]|uniref:Thioredoxin fold domain-containing protein n=1 Tax=Alcanivorax sediminis TaxID=2663008 RepID=A0A6N7LQ30_9GAMM|nr:thioredoxin fold domain-containing protein [Alcanivorax sediminis]MQX52072.1 thioredoxin fold domain-containing protein [Alcanivorax sediminis]
MKTARLLLALLMLPLLAQAKSDPAMEELLGRLESSHWVAEGPKKPERVAYVFTDMACAYCARLWVNMQPMVNDPDNTLEVRHIIVGMIHPKRSFTQGAAVLGARHPANALARHESQFQQGGIRPVEPVPAAIRSQIHSNTGLFIHLGLQGTPTLFYQGRNGKWHSASGVIGERDLREKVFRLQ